MQYIQQPQAIEAKSFDIISEIIAETRPDYRFASPLHEAIIKRVIHTTADFDYARNLRFTPGAVAAGVAALQAAAPIVTDTNMALSGMEDFRCKTYVYWEPPAPWAKVRWKCWLFIRTNFGSFPLPRTATLKSLPTSRFVSASSAWELQMPPRLTDSLTFWKLYRKR